MENKIKWDGSQEAYDLIQAQAEKLGNVYVTQSDKGKLSVTLNGKEKTYAKGRNFYYTTEDVIEEEVVIEAPKAKPLVNERGEFLSRKINAARK